MSDKSLILIEENSSSQAETASLVGAAVLDVGFSSYRIGAPEEKTVAWRGEESPFGVLARRVENDDVCDDDAGT